VGESNVGRERKIEGRGIINEKGGEKWEKKWEKSNRKEKKNGRDNKR